MTMNNNDTYHDELTAHLAAQEHPQPHPKRYDHGYMRNDPVMVTTIDGKQFTVEEWAKIKAAPARKPPGPITMQEPRVDWMGWAMFAGGLLAAGMGTGAYFWGK